MQVASLAVNSNKFRKGFWGRSDANCIEPGIMVQCCLYIKVFELKHMQRISLRERCAALWDIM